jgi:SAM-dependent methyltransferase
MSDRITLSDRQAAHYDRILDEYDRHYYDQYSTLYRRRFILDPLLDGVDLSGKVVADLTCGSGQTSLELAVRFPDIQLTGFDISSKACSRYREKVGRPCYELDLTHEYHGNERFDVAVIIGGLHHCVSNLPAAIATIRAMLKPSGTLLMYEPNSHCFLEFARRVWYRVDSYFDAETEASLAHSEILAASRGAFVAERVQYVGGPAFYLVYNSLVFRLPHRVKRAIAPSLLAAESAWSLLPGSWPYASFAARWTASPAS